MNKINSLKDITIKKYLEFNKKFEDLTDNDKNNDVLITRFTLKHFYDLSDEEYSKLSYLKTIELNKTLTNIFNSDINLVQMFDFNGVLYGINPNWSELTFGEMVDLNCNDVVKQIAILYRPVFNKTKDNYEIEQYKANLKHLELFRNELTMDIYQGFVGFFLKIRKKMLNYTLNSLGVKGLTPEQMRFLEQSGGGLDGFTNYAPGI